MCGRFALFRDLTPLCEDLGAEDLSDPHAQPRWNIPPTVPIHVVTESVDKESGAVLRALRTARWGLLPPFAQDLAFGSRTFNARRETLIEKPSFRGCLGKYRALIPMDGYFEWKRTDSGAKQPFFIRPADGSALLTAALVTWWRGPGGHTGPAASPDGGYLLTATVITRQAGDVLGDIHDRAPVMLRREVVDSWLDTAMSDAREAQAWIADDTHLVPEDALELQEVDPAVGRVGVEGPTVLQPPQRLL